MLKRITQDESRFYLHLDSENPSTPSRAIAFTLTDLGGGWERVDYFGESIFDPTGSIRKPEWVYVLVNKDIPGVSKIGMTTTSVEQRCREINSATGVISPWFPVYRFKCVNSYFLEQDVHKYLQDKGYRVASNREGFYIDSQTAKEVIESLGQRYQTPISLESQEISSDLTDTSTLDSDTENQG
jgi:hypothetical protein